MPQPKKESYGGEGIEGRGPNGPHLALVTNISGAAVAIPPGALMYLIEDAGNINKIFPLVLAEGLDHKHIRFKCGCGKEGCNRTVVFKATWKGYHPQSDRPTAGPQ